MQGEAEVGLEELLLVLLHLLLAEVEVEVEELLQVLQVLLHLLLHLLLAEVEVEVEGEVGEVTFFPLLSMAGATQWPKSLCLKWP